MLARYASPVSYSAGVGQERTAIWFSWAPAHPRRTRSLRVCRLAWEQLFVFERTYCSLGRSCFFGQTRCRWCCCRSWTKLDLIFSLLLLGSVDHYPVYRILSIILKAAGTGLAGPRDYWIRMVTRQRLNLGGLGRSWMFQTSLAGESEKKLLDRC